MTNEKAFQGIIIKDKDGNVIKQIEAPDEAEKLDTSDFPSGVSIKGNITWKKRPANE